MGLVVVATNCRRQFADQKAGRTLGGPGACPPDFFLNYMSKYGISCILCSYFLASVILVLWKQKDKTHSIPGQLATGRRLRYVCRHTHKTCCGDVVATLIVTVATCGHLATICPPLQNVATKHRSDASAVNINFVFIIIWQIWRIQTCCMPINMIEQFDPQNDIHLHISVNH